MHGKHHLMAGLILTIIIHVFLSVHHFGEPFPNPNMAAFFGGVVGALFCDFDLIFGLKFHRNSLMHSSFFPFIFTISYLFDVSYPGLTYLLLFFNIGVVSHLLLDIIPASIPKENRGNIGGRWWWRLGQVARGKVGGNIVGPPFGVGPRNEQKYLILNALICMALAMINYLTLTGVIVIV